MKADAARNPFSKIVWVIFVSWLALLIFGLAAFPYAPIRPEGESFVNKKGTVFTETQYRHFKVWEATYLFMSLAVFSLAAGKVIYRRFRRQGLKLLL